MGLISAIFLLFPISSFIFPTVQPTLSDVFFGGIFPPCQAKLSSDSAFAESQVTLAQPGDGSSSLLLSCAVDTKYWQRRIGRVYTLGPQGLRAPRGCISPMVRFLSGALCGLVGTVSSSLASEVAPTSLRQNLGSLGISPIWILSGLMGTIYDMGNSLPPRLQSTLSLVTLVY